MKLFKNRSWSLRLQTVAGASRSVFLSLIILFSLLATPAPAIIDQNNNGISDVFEIEYNNGQLFPNNLNLHSDADGDGWDFLLEAIAGTDPFDGNPPTGMIRPQAERIPAVYLNSQNSNPPTMVSPEAESLTWPSVKGKQYTLEFSADLMTNWLPVGDPMPGTGEAMSRTMQLTQLDGSIPPKLFWRVAVNDLGTDIEGEGITQYEEHLLGLDPPHADNNNNEIPDDWELANSGKFAAYPHIIYRALNHEQTATAPLYLHNDTGLSINYTISAQNNTFPIYSFKDSLTGGVPFVWEEISTTGTRLTNVNPSEDVSQNDDASQPVAFTGFTFPFEGQNYSQVHVSSNGLLSFGTASNAYSNQALPTTTPPLAFIAAFWDDLNTAVSGDIYWKQESDRLIVQYQDVGRYGGVGTYTFQVALFADGRIQLRYITLGGVTHDCTVGIQDATQSRSLQMAYNANYLTDSMAIEIRPSSEFFTPTILSGNIAAHSIASIPCVFHSLGLPPGYHLANLSISHDAPGNNPLPITALLRVLNSPSMVALSQPLAGGSLIQGEPLQLSATASDAEGVAKVRFYDSLTLLGESSVPPYTTAAYNLAVGPHSFIARAIDNFDAKTDSAPVSFTILADADSDHIPDAWETANDLNPLVDDSDEDPDQDGYTNLEEYQLGKNPNFAEDSDGDGMPDGWESHNGLNIAVNDASGDLDHDGLTNIFEYQHHTNPKSPDTDFDRLPDEWEVANALNPNSGTGDDGGTGDPDHDGATNFVEWQNGTNPHIADSDGDGVNDGPEIAQGSNPNDPSDGGKPPPVDKIVEVPFRVGDSSGSHSESWNMRITGKGPDDHRAIIVASPSYGEIAVQTLKLVKTNQYEIVLQHFQTDPAYLADHDGESDYDWEAQIDGKPIVPVLGAGVKHDAAGADAFFMLEDHWLVDNRDGLLGVLDSSFDNVDFTPGKKVVLYPVDAKEVWSDQIADVEANGYPNMTGLNEYPFILMGANSESNFKVKVKLYSDIPAAAQSRLLYRWAYKGFFVDLIPDDGTSTFSDPKTVRLDIDLSLDGDDRYLVVGYDENSDGELGLSENKIRLMTPHIQHKIMTSIPYKFVPVTAVNYDENKTELLGWASNAETVGILRNSARHLTAFCNGALPIAAGSEPTTIRRNEPGLSHPVGVAFTPVSSPGGSFKAIISKDHPLSEKLVTSSAIISWLEGEFNAVGDERRGEIVKARRTGGIEKLSCSIPAKITSVSFGLSDPDLLVSLHKADLVDPVIDFDVDMYGYVSNVQIFGFAEDLYDFDYGAGFINTEVMGLPARPAAKLQAGFPTLGTGGKVFKTKIDLGGNNPYSNPDHVPYTFFPTE